MRWSHLMVGAKRSQQGMSLVELMVTMVIVVILVMLSVPLTRGWVINAHLNHARDILVEGYATARALALQNPGDARGANAAASLSLNQNTLTVSYTLNSVATTVWSSTVDTDTTVSLTDGACQNTLAFANTGLPLNTDCLNYGLAIDGSIAETGILE